MATARGNQLAEEIRQKVAELKRVCEGVDESMASRAPAGRWSPKEILSHLCGREHSGHLPILRAFLEGENPTINLDTENPFFTEERARMSFTQLLAECENEYERIARFATELTQEQLGRRAHVPKLKESPLGEYPTLEGMINGLALYHVKSHTDHLREILHALEEDDITDEE